MAEHPLKEPVIHPSVFVAPSAGIYGDVTLGRDCSVWFGTVIRADMAAVVVGECTNLQDLTVVHQDTNLPCIVGSRVTVGHRVILHGCTIGDDCLIGMGAILLNGCKVGAGAIVGAGALVPEGAEIPAGQLALGLPAKVVRPVKPEETERIARGWKHYVEEGRRYRERFRQAG